jgi:hypothetical protein
MFERFFVIFFVLAFLASEFESGRKLLETLVTSIVAVELEEDFFVSSNHDHQTRESDSVRSMFRSVEDVGDG